MENLINILQIRLTSNLVLRSSFGSISETTLLWKPVINNIRTRSGLWKGCLLSMTRRVCLIKTVLSSLFLYYMFVFLMPKEIVRVITSIKRRFLWCGDSKDRKIYKVSWKMMVRGKNRGALGIASLEGKNKALLHYITSCSSMLKH